MTNVALATIRCVYGFYILLVKLKLHFNLFQVLKMSYMVLVNYNNPDAL